MAAIAFDPMDYMQQLEAAGMPRNQAEAVVKGFSAMFIHNFDALVTKDYLDTRFSEFESRVDLRFATLESRMDVRFARVNAMLGVILVAVAIPVLQTLPI